MTALRAALSNGWLLFGFLGTVLFSTRWLVQLIASHRARKSVITPMFWLMSLLGSLVLLTYFSIGPHRDAVGVVANAFPLCVALYNLMLVRKPGVTDR